MAKFYDPLTERWHSMYEAKPTAAAVAEPEDIYVRADCFKPIVRVKAQCVPSLSLLINRAVAEFAKLSPLEKNAIYKAQAESWARSCVGFD